MSADLIIINGRVLTMDELRPRTEALAIQGGRIVKVGRTRDVLALKSRRTKIIDAVGNSVIPGLIEGHMHVFSGGADMNCLHLHGVDGEEALRRALQDYAGRHPGDDILVGKQTNYTILGEGIGLTRQHLDRILPDRPVLLYAPDHHTAWANTMALKMAGILGGRVLPPGHEIVMGPDGLANGELREPSAIDPVADFATELSRARLGLSTGGEPEPYPGPTEFGRDLQAVQRALALCASLGITSFHNMDGSLYTMELLAALEREGALTARALVPFHFKPFMPLSALERASTMAKAYSSDMLKSGLVKLFMDGVLDSGTAVMLDDYPDRRGWRGDPLFSADHFNAIATEIDRRGLQIAVHAIGDGAVRMVLDGYEAALKANGRRDSRHRIEHIEIVHADDIKRFRKLGVIASVQPPHPPGQQGLPLEPTISKIGAAKWGQAYLWNDFRKARVPLVFGTDWPVSDINPFRSMHAAMTRTSWAKGIADHRQTLQQALHGYTVAGAHAEFADGKKGVLRKGALGDAVVLDCDVEAIDPQAMQHVKPIATVVGGRVVYRR